MLPIRLVLVFLLLAGPVSGQYTARLVKDLSTRESSPVRDQDIGTFRGHFYFLHADSQHGLELWRASPDKAPGLFMDMLPGLDAFEKVSAGTEFEGRFFFMGLKGGEGQLWKTDGTVGGTSMVLAFPQVIVVSPPVVSGGKLYFTVKSDEIPDGGEVWSYSSGGKVEMVGSGSCYPFFLFNYKDRLYYRSCDEEGTAFWFTDGTSSPVKVPELGFSYHVPQPVEVGGYLYYPVKNQADSIWEVWKYDGYVSTLVKRFWKTESQETDAVRGFIAAEDKLYINMDSAGVSTAWVSDGTEEGTVRLLAADSLPFSRVDGVFPINGRLLLSGSKEGRPYGLWVDALDGNGLQEISKPGEVFAEVRQGVYYRNRLYFARSFPGTSRDLWVSDGTAEGTHFVAGLSSREYYLNGLLTVIGDRMLIRHDHYLWQLDPGTGDMKQLLAPFLSSRSTYFVNSAALDSKLLFTAQTNLERYSLFASDGTTAGTVQLDPPELTLLPGDQMASLGEFALFFWKDSLRRKELWRSDGTVEGTRLIRKVQTRPGNLYNDGMAVWNGKLYFSSDSGLTGRELWVSDGSPEGTYAITQVNEYENDGLDEFTVYGDKLYFTGSMDEKDGIIVSDGTSDGTRLFFRSPPESRDFLMGTAGGYLLFAFNTPDDMTLWRTDGVETTRLNTFGRSSLRYWSTGKLIFFTVEEDGLTYLWRTDGTAGGTFQVGGAQPVWLLSSAVFGDQFVHEALRPEPGLWATSRDGTGYHLLKGGDGRFTVLGVADSLLFFQEQQSYGSAAEFFVSDGTPEGTRKLEALSRQGLVSCEDLQVAGGRIFITCSDVIHGHELYVLEPEKNTGSFLIYPNPASGLVQFGVGSGVEYMIMDVSGRKVIEGEYGGAVDISGLSGGVYQVRVLVAGLPLYGRLVVP